MVLMALEKAIRAASPLQAVALKTDILGRVAIVLTDPTLFLLPPTQQPNSQPQHQLRNIPTLATFIKRRHLALPRRVLLERPQPRTLRRMILELKLGIRQSQSP